MPYCLLYQTMSPGEKTKQSHCVALCLIEHKTGLVYHYRVHEITLAHWIHRAIKIISQTCSSFHFHWLEHIKGLFPSGHFSMLFSTVLFFWITKPPCWIKSVLLEGKFDVSTALDHGPCNYSVKYIHCYPEGTLLCVSHLIERQWPCTQRFNRTLH